MFWKWIKLTLKIIWL